MNKNLHQETKTIFQKFTELPISDDVADEIEHNLIGLFELILEWNYTEREEDRIC